MSPTTTERWGPGRLCRCLHPDDEHVAVYGRREGHLILKCDCGLDCDCRDFELMPGQPDAVLLPDDQREAPE